MSPSLDRTRPSGLAPLELALMYASSAVVGGTGLLYAWFRYVAVPADPYAVVSHPWQPFVQHAHVLAAPLLVFAAGALWRPHVIARWRKDAATARRSGLSLALSTFPMIASGYLLQVAVEEPWRRAWGWIHTGVSLAWLVGLTVHVLARDRQGRAPRGVRAPGASSVRSSSRGDS